MSSIPTLPQALTVFSRELFTTLFHPRFLFFLPCLPLHIPVYITGSLSERLLGIPGEEESKAQRKAVCSGLVFGIISSFCGAKLVKISMDQPAWLLSYIRKAGLGFLTIREGVEPIRGARKVLSLAFMMYLTTRVLFRWHNALIGGSQFSITTEGCLSNFNSFKEITGSKAAILPPLRSSILIFCDRYRRLAASWKILLGVLSPASSDEKAAEISSITRPPIPASNPFVKRKEDTGGDLPRVAAIHAGTQARMETRRIPSRTLARQLFSARTEAEYIVEKFRLTV
ncbi:hypothetical protein PHLCEN_2v12645 [Hermanssonia centrifuga]|uniref:Uncharacterized protein n=1 Tax=Hermanssonia centrifuga TaxID=98765 RepID=A0A2R6NGG3_9APHY|nr:hypothetical protein PHLCEN_2v12645 [Hermanssonia centrifuga]